MLCYTKEVPPEEDSPVNGSCHQALAFSVSFDCTNDIIAGIVISQVHAQMNVMTWKHRGFFFEGLLSERTRQIT